MTTSTGRAADWRADGACAHADSDLFFPVSMRGPALTQVARAKAICAGCPVSEQCLSFALEHEPGHGIWGGTTPEERQQVRPQRVVRAPAIPGA